MRTLAFSRRSSLRASDNAKQEQKEIAGLKVTLVDVAGDYTGKHREFAADVTQSGFRMILAVIPIDDQLYFIKAVGPQQTIAANVDAINAFRRLPQAKQAGRALRNNHPVRRPARCVLPVAAGSGLNSECQAALDCLARSQRRRVYFLLPLA